MNHWVRSSRRFGRQIVTGCMLLVIRAYQLVLSPWLGNQCRFYPSCSHYTADAIVQYGPWRGAWLGGRRLLRCQPFARGGLDPVPAISAKDIP